MKISIALVHTGEQGRVSNFKRCPDIMLRGQNVHIGMCTDWWHGYMTFYMESCPYSDEVVDTIARKNVVIREFYARPYFMELLEASSMK